VARPTLPAKGDLNWDAVMNAAINNVSDRADLALQNANGIAGATNFDAFTGSTDDAKMTSCLSYVAQQTYVPAVRLSNRQYSFNGPYTMVNGLTLIGPFMEREYSISSTLWANQSNCIIKTNSTGSYFWGIPGTVGAGNTYTGSVYFSGMQWDGTNQDHDWIIPVTSNANGGPVLSLSTFRDFGVKNYRKPFHMVVQACNMFNFHFQSNSDIHIWWQGADSTIGVVGMHQFLDNAGAGKPSMQIGLDASFISGLYLTPTAAGCAIRHDRGTGTIYTANNFDSADQKGSAASCKGSLIQLRGGTTVWNGTRLFGCMTDPTNADGGTAQNKGYITATGGSHVFNGATFENGTSRGSSDFTPGGTNHLYATNGVSKVVVAGLAAAAPATLILKQQSSGLIITDMSTFLSVG
jgi:hypothetical protein